MSPLKLGDFIQVYVLPVDTMICALLDDGTFFDLSLFQDERAKEYYSYSVFRISYLPQKGCLVLVLG